MTMRSQYWLEGRMIYGWNFKMTKGGKREGAGRPKARNARVRISVRVKPRTKEIIREQRINAGRVLDEVIKERSE